MFLILSLTYFLSFECLFLFKIRHHRSSPCCGKPLGHGAGMVMCGGVCVSPFRTMLPCPCVCRTVLLHTSAVISYIWLKCALQSCAFSGALQAAAACGFTYTIRMFVAQLNHLAELPRVVFCVLVFDADGLARRKSPTLFVRSVQ